MSSEVNIFAGTAKEPVFTISRIEIAAKSVFMYQLINSLNICDGCGETISIIFAEEKKETLVTLMTQVIHFKKSGLSINKGKLKFFNKLPFFTFELNIYILNCSDLDLDTNDVKELRRKIGLNKFEQLTKRDLENEYKNIVEQEIADENGIRDNNFNFHAATDEIVTAQILDNKAEERINDEQEAAENNEFNNCENGNHEDVNEDTDNDCSTSVSNLSLHLRKHSKKLAKDPSDMGSTCAEIKKVAVNLENLNLKSLKIKPDDPIPKRRLTLEKCDTGYKILTPQNSSSNFNSVDHCSNCGLDNDHGSMISCTKCTQKWHLHCVNLDTAMEEELAKDFFCYSCSNVPEETDVKYKSKHRCQICSNVFFSQRAQLLRHYSRIHFNEHLMKYIDPAHSLKCRLCSYVGTQRTDVLGHIGAKHKKVLQFLP